MKNSKKNILHNIIFYTLILQSLHVISNQELPRCFLPTQTPQRGLPPLPLTKEQKKKKEEEKASAFNNLLEKAKDFDLPGIPKSNQAEQPDSDATTDQLTQQESPPISYAHIQYYERFQPQPNNANELCISNDVIPKIFLKHYNQEEPLIPLNLHPVNISLLEHIHREAKKITEDPLSFKITIGEQSYNIHYLTFNNDCRSLGEQIQNIIDSESSDSVHYSLIIDEQNIVTLKNTQGEFLLLRCTDHQFNHITTTEQQFCLTILDSRYAIMTINNNGTITELTTKKEPSYQPLPSNVPAKPDATNEEKEKYRRFKEERGLNKTTQISTDADSATPQPEEQKSFISHKWLLIGGIGVSIVTIATVIYFFLATPR